MKGQRWLSVLLLIALIHLGAIGIALREGYFQSPQWVSAHVVSSPSEHNDTAVVSETSATPSASTAHSATTSEDTAEMISSGKTNDGLKANILASKPNTAPSEPWSASAQEQNTRHAAGNGVQSQSSETIGDGAQSNHAVLTLPTHIGGHLHNPRPAYPEFSKENGEQGEVTLSVMVEPNGRASAVDVVQGSGYARLDRAAHDTVLNQYRFTPATRGGQAIAYRYRFSIVFKLNR